MTATVITTKLDSSDSRLLTSHPTPHKADENDRQLTVNWNNQQKPSGPPCPSLRHSSPLQPEPVVGLGHPSWPAGQTNQGRSYPIATSTHFVGGGELQVEELSSLGERAPCSILIYISINWFYTHKNPRFIVVD